MGAATEWLHSDDGMLGPWFDSRTRGLAAGLASAGGSSAFVVAGVVVPWLTSEYLTLGWRYAWVLFGAATVSIGAVALGYVRDRRPEASAPPSPPAALGQGVTWPVEVNRNALVWLMSFIGGLWLVAASSNTFLGTYLSGETVFICCGWPFSFCRGLKIGSGLCGGAYRTGSGAVWHLYAFFWSKVSA